MRGRPRSQDGWLFLAFLAVVVLFALATIVSQRIGRTIESTSRTITENSGPSILQLSIARSTLSLEQLRIDDYLDAASGGTPQPRQMIDQPWKRFIDALSAYRAIPLLPGETPIVAPLSDNVAEVMRLREQVLVLTDQGRFPEAVALEKGELDHAMHTVRDRLDRLIAYDAGLAAQLGERIHAMHLRARVVGLLLDALVGLITVGVAGLVWRKMRLTRDDLETKNRELEERGLELEQFSGRMAHDVLSPLFTAGLGWELARKLYPEDERLARLAETSRAAIQRSRRLVEDLLAFSLAGAQAGGSTEVGPVLADVLMNLEAEAREAGVQLLSQPLPTARVGCSPGVLTSILLNLLRNAIKHMGGASDRKIELRTQLKGGVFRCEIADTGPGIPEVDQQTIFEPYVRGNTKAAGIGLGLATVKRLVAGHGGAVGVDSSPGKGAKFWFELPVVATADAQAPLYQ